ncbi:unnamed protein product [Musa acuminata subsp. malaccensis]|uniref:(wild Malaysian banana) hypothetical protein n=1 Tax=Musa acuminata subsp. malaccensis TaxID=214687 RepID=A0A804KZL2_MUSAM|nr:unnamed protein product [Musa acuminata subsp. malaccensis]
MRYVRGIQLNRVPSSAASIYGRRVVGDLLRDPGPGVPSCLFGQGFGRGFPSVAVADGAFWEDASGLCRTCLTSSRRRPMGGGLQSLGLGALDNSFLACGSGIPVVNNFAHVIHGKVVSVKIFGNGAAVDRISPREGGSNTLLMSPAQTGVSHASHPREMGPSLCSLWMEDRFAFKEYDVNGKECIPGLTFHVDVIFDENLILGRTNTNLIAVPSWTKMGGRRVVLRHNGTYNCSSYIVEAYSFNKDLSLKYSPLGSSMAGLNSRFQTVQVSWVPRSAVAPSWMKHHVR